MKYKKTEELNLALEKLLILAEQKLQYAVDRKKDWDIEHYKKDIEFLRNELRIVKGVKNYEN
jgi:hypothetical protein